jgi:GT2 family glycosyltransferase
VLLHTGVRSGPAAARNLGANQARHPILLFVDADVELHHDVRARVCEHFSSDPSLTGLFGSYDDTPAAPGLVSHFRNLLHHYTHNNHPGPACTFWAGCGAVRRDRFLALGGFDAETYRQPCIEDIELGLRLHDAGERILLDPAIQGKHHKCWTFGLMVRTDISQRAIPWSRLLLSRRRLPATLNLSSSARISAGLSLLLPGALAVAASSSALQPWAQLMFAGCLGLFMQINRSFLGLLWRQGGLRLAATGTSLLILYLIYSSLSFAGVATAAMASAPVRAPDWLQSRPDLQQRLAMIGLLLLGLLSIAYLTKGLMFLFTGDRGGRDLLERFDEWRLFQSHIYPSKALANQSARLLPHFRTTVYLPWALPQFGFLFGWGGIAQGKILISLVSLLSLAMMATVGRWMMRPLGQKAGWLGFLTPLAFFSNYICLAAGQFSILCVGLISLQFYFLRKRQTLAAGICWAMAMLKPQLALAYAIPLLGRRKRIGLVFGLSLLIILTLIALQQTNTDAISIGLSWLKVLPAFQSTGNTNVLAAVWPNTSRNQIIIIVILMAILVTVKSFPSILHRLRAAINTTFRTIYYNSCTIEAAGLFGICSLLLFYTRTYDIVLLYPAVIVLLRNTLYQPRWGLFILTALMTFSLFYRPMFFNQILGFNIQPIIWCLSGAYLLRLMLLERLIESPDP